MSKMIALGLSLLFVSVATANQGTRVLLKCTVPQGATIPEGAPISLSAEGMKYYLHYDLGQIKSDGVKVEPLSSFEFMGFEGDQMITLEFIRQERRFLFSIWDFNTNSSIVAPTYLDCIEPR